MIITAGTNEHFVIRTDRHLVCQSAHVTVQFPLGHGFGQIEVRFSAAVLRNGCKQIIQIAGTDLFQHIGDIFLRVR